MNESQVLQQVRKETAMLEDKYKQYIGPLRESRARMGKKLDEMSLGVVLHCLKELDKDIAIVESTQSINVGTFIQHGYDLITAIYPNLVANTIGAVQPLLSRSGDVWYYDLVYQDAKGLVTQNQPALSATIGNRADKHYTSEYIDVIATVDGSNPKEYTGTIAHAPLRTNAGMDFFTATDGNETFTVDPTNYANLIGDQGGTGSLSVQAGTFTLFFFVAPTDTVVATGKVDFETDPTAIGRAKISLVNKSMNAQKHSLITDYTLDAEHDMSRNFNLNLSDELVKGTSALIRAELDMLIMDDIRVAAKSSAGAGVVGWDGDYSGAGISQLDHFRTLLTVFKHQSNKIFSATRMVFGNFVITGVDVASAIEALPEYRLNPSIGTELSASGPYIAGTIGGLTHIKNPAFDPDEWVVGNKGVSAFNTGFILGPYKGLFVTGPISNVENPFSITRGLWLEAGRLVTNAKFFSYGKATNLNF